MLMVMMMMMRWGMVVTLPQSWIEVLLGIRNASLVLSCPSSFYSTLFFSYLFIYYCYYAPHILNSAFASTGWRKGNMVGGDYLDCNDEAMRSTNLEAHGLFGLLSRSRICLWPGRIACMLWRADPKHPFLLIIIIIILNLLTISILLH